LCPVGDDSQSCPPSSKDPVFSVCVGAFPFALPISLPLLGLEHAVFNKWSVLTSTAIPTNTLSINPRFYPCPVTPKGILSPVYSALAHRSPLFCPVCLSLVFRVTVRFCGVLTPNSNVLFFFPPVVRCVALPFGPQLALILAASLGSEDFFLVAGTCCSQPHPRARAFLNPVTGFFWFSHLSFFTVHPGFPPPLVLHISLFFFQNISVATCRLIPLSS